MNPEAVFLYIILIHVICGFTNFINSLGYPREERGFMISLGLIPILAQFFFIRSIYKIIKRFFYSKARCGLGHKFVLKSYKGEDGSPGSHKIFTCSRCQYETIVSYPTKEEIREKWGWQID